MNCLVDYEYKITCEDVGKTIGVSVRNGVQTGKYISHYRSFSKGTRAIMKSSMA